MDESVLLELLLISLWDYFSLVVFVLCVNKAAAMVDSAMVDQGCCYG